MEAIADKFPDDPPPALEARPCLEAHLFDYLEAFFLLSPSRQIGFGPGGILLSEMAVYCQIHRIANVPRFVRIIRAIDAVYLAHVAETLKKP